MKTLAIIAAVGSFELAITVTYLFVRYIPFDGGSTAGASALVVCSALGAGLVWFVLSRFPNTRRSVVVTSCVLGAVLILPAASMAYPGQVTAAWFGFTAYGLIPVPFLDLTVGTNAVLGFRTKTHLITVAEVAPLVGPDTERVVIGTGWQRAAAVEAGVLELLPGRVDVLATHDGVALFNRLKREGRRVVLVAHSTC